MAVVPAVQKYLPGTKAVPISLSSLCISLSVSSLLEYLCEFTLNLTGAVYMKARKLDVIIVILWTASSQYLLEMVYRRNVYKCTFF